MLADKGAAARTTEAKDFLPMDAAAHCLIHSDGRLVHLTPTEWRLLEFLWHHRNARVPAVRLYNLVWANAPSSPGHNILAVYMYRLRRKLEDTSWRIASTMGHGVAGVYCLQPDWTPDEPAGGLRGVQNA